MPDPSASSGPLRADRTTRTLGAVLAALALAVLILASILHPDPTGMNTHTQIGLPRCGWLLTTGYPCPTCGMTTSFAFAAHGSPLASFMTQPFGAFLALATAVFFWGSLHVACFGSRLGRLFERLLAPRVLWVTLALFLAAWGYKIWCVRAMA